MSIQEIIQQKIDLEDIKEALQYYEYLRTVTEVNQLSYWIGNPSVEIISGKMMLQPLKPSKTIKQPQNFEQYLRQIYKVNKYELKKVEKKQDFTQKDNELQQNNLNKIQCLQNKQKLIQSRCLVICGIPNSKSPVQVMQTQCISKNSEFIKEIRVIKTAHIRYYGMLLLMKDHNSASYFYNQLFGCSYNDLQMQRIIIRQIKNISLSFSQLNSQQVNNQMLLLRSIKQENQFIFPQNVFMSYHHQKIKQKLLMEKINQKNFNQLVCAICFEQCNNLAISILCGHYFDLQCLEQWSQNICPLCRFHQQPPIIKFCEKCNQCEGLWVCLICGARLCCGTNNDILGQDSHIYYHFKTTNHSLSMELQTKFLFDAKIPAFLHKKFYKDLIQTKEGQQNEMRERNVQQNNKKSKISEHIKEYQNQVSQQMRKQRLYFQQGLNTDVKQHRLKLDQKRKRVQQLRRQIQRIQRQQQQQKEKGCEYEEKLLYKSKELQVVTKMMSMKREKVEQKRREMEKKKGEKVRVLRKVQEEIREKREEVLNYRRNVQLREKWGEMLKGEEVAIHRLQTIVQINNQLQIFQLKNSSSQIGLIPRKLGNILDSLNRRIKRFSYRGNNIVQKQQEKEQMTQNGLIITSFQALNDILIIFDIIEQYHHFLYVS